MKPIRIALIVSMAYIIPSMIYIVLSSTWTADLAASPEQAATIEVIKGLAFVAVSGGLVFAVCWKTLSLVENRRYELKSTRESLLYAERRAIAGLLAGSVAHDARNVLTMLKSNNEFLQQRDNSDEVLAEILEEQAEAIDRLVEMTQKLSDAGKYEVQASRQNLDLVELAVDASDSLRTHTRLRGRHVEVVTDLESAPITAFPTLVYQILINLLFNAADAVGLEGQIEIHIGRDGERFTLAVHDDGPGIAEENRGRVFEAFYTTKEAGTGLGLLSVRTSARAHGGDVEIDDSPLGGACVRVCFEGVEEDPYDSFEGPMLFSGSKKRAPDTAQPVG